MPGKKINLKQLVDNFYQPVTRFSQDQVQTIFKGFFETMLEEFDSPDFNRYKLVGFGTVTYKPVKAVTETLKMVGLWELGYKNDAEMRYLLDKLLTIINDSVYGRTRFEREFPNFNQRLRKADWWEDFCSFAREDYGFDLDTSSNISPELVDGVRDSTS